MCLHFNAQGKLCGMGTTTVPDTGEETETEEGKATHPGSLSSQVGALLRLIVFPGVVCLCGALSLVRRETCQFSEVQPFPLRLSRLFPPNEQHSK